MLKLFLSVEALSCLSVEALSWPSLRGQRAYVASVAYVEIGTAGSGDGLRRRLDEVAAGPET